MIIGCDFHPRFQQIAMVDSTPGEVTERRLGGAPRRVWMMPPLGAGELADADAISELRLG